MEDEIIFRAVIEVLGKPEKHVEESLQGYVKQLKENDRYDVQAAEFAEVKKQDEQELWAGFSEVEVKVKKMEDITAFCFDFMPSLIEMISPKELKIGDSEISQFLNDLQAKLHQIDMVAKQVKMENEILHKNMAYLLGNYVTLLLRKGNMTSQELSRLTGVDVDKLEDFLDNLIDKGKVDLRSGIYFLKEPVEKKVDEKEMKNG